MVTVSRFRYYCIIIVQLKWPEWIEWNIKLQDILQLGDNDMAVGVASSVPFPALYKFFLEYESSFFTVTQHIPKQCPMSKLKDICLYNHDGIEYSCIPFSSDLLYNTIKEHLCVVCISEQLPYLICHTKMLLVRGSHKTRTCL